MRFPIDLYTLAAYDFDDTSTSASKDSSGVAGDLTLAGTPGRGADLLGDASSGSLSLNGTTQYGSRAGLLDTWPTFATLLGVFKPSAANLNARFFSKNNDGSHNLLELYVNGSGFLSLNCAYNASAGNGQYASAIAVASGTQITVAISYGIRGWELWGNGVMEVPSNHAYNLPAAGSTQPWVFAGQAATPVANFFAGGGDAARIYSYQPTQAELAAWTTGTQPAQVAEYRLWQEWSGNGVPFIAPTQAAEVLASQEASIIVKPSGLFSPASDVLALVYTGGYDNQRMWYAEWNGTGAPLRSNGPVLGGGVGGEAGIVCRPNWWLNGTIDTVTYRNNSTPGDLLYAVSADQGATWTATGTLVASTVVSGHGFTGMANSTDPMLIGATWYMVVEAYVTATSVWNLILLKSTAGPLTGWTYVTTLTGLQYVAGGTYGSPWWTLIGSTLHVEFHATPITANVLPTALAHGTVDVANIENGALWAIRATDYPTRQYVSKWEINQDADPSCCYWRGRCWRAFSMGNDSAKTFAIMLESYAGQFSDLFAGVPAIERFPAAAQVQYGTNVGNGQVGTGGQFWGFKPPDFFE